jgi:hypothetical protein
MHDRGGDGEEELFDVGGKERQCGEDREGNHGFFHLDLLQDGKCGVH